MNIEHIENAKKLLGVQALGVAGQFLGAGIGPLVEGNFQQEVQQALEPQNPIVRQIPDGLKEPPVQLVPIAFPEPGLETDVVTQTVAPKLSGEHAQDYWTDQRLQAEGLMPKPGETPDIPVDEAGQAQLKEQYSDMPEYLQSSGEVKVNGLATQLNQEPPVTPGITPIPPEIEATSEAKIGTTGAVFTEHPVIEGKVFEVVGPGTKLRIGPDVILRDLLGAETTDKLNDNVAEVVIVEGDMVIIEDGRGNEYKVWAGDTSEKTQLTPGEMVEEVSGGDNPSTSLTPEQKQNLETVMGQKLKAEGKQNLSWNPEEDPSLWIKTDDGSALLLEGREAVVKPDGTILVKVKCIDPDNNIYSIDGRQLLAWINLSGVQGELASLTADQLKELGFEVKKEEIKLPENLKNLIPEGFGPVNYNDYPPGFPDRTDYRISEGIGYIGEAAPIKAVRWTNAFGIQEGHGGVFHGRVINAYVKSGTNEMYIELEAFGAIGSAKHCLVHFPDTFSTITFVEREAGYQLMRQSGFSPGDIKQRDYMTIYTWDEIAGLTPDKVEGAGVDLYW